MIRLSKQEELNILYALNPDDFFDEGSSRKVFKFNDKLVKLAVDEGGRLQNKNELYVAQNYPDLVANIYAYGDLILVVEPLDFYNEDEWKPFIDEVCEYGYNEDDGFEYAWEEIINYHTNNNNDEFNPSKDLCKSAFELLTTANGVLGVSSDNGQMGWSKIDNCFKLYDAGFLCDEDIKVASSGRNYMNLTQIGSIQDYNDAEAIELAIKTLKNEDK